MSTSLLEVVPERVGSRRQAREMLEGIWSEVRGSFVVLDCSPLTVSTPSFTDELILALLVEGGAHKLTLRGAPTRTADFARRSATLRGVAEKLAIE